MKKVFIVCLALCFASAAIAGGKNLVELHQNPGKLTKMACLACHAGITKETSLNKKYKTFHRLHLESKKDTPKNCAGCHQSVDLREGSASALRKQVNPQLCAGCHSGGVKGAKVLFVK